MNQTLNTNKKYVFLILSPQCLQYSTNIYAKHPPTKLLAKYRIKQKKQQVEGQMLQERVQKTCIFKLLLLYNTSVDIENIGEPI